MRVFVEDNTGRIHNLEPTLKLNCLELFGVARLRSDRAHLRAFQAVDETALANVGIPNNTDRYTLRR